MATEPAPAAETTTVVEAVDLTKHFPVRERGRARGRRGLRVVRAVEGVSLALRAGQVTALVGESGSGKSTVGRLLAQLERATAGEIRLRGDAVQISRRRSLRKYVGEVQLILQDPFASLNPTHTIGHHLIRPLRIHGWAKDRTEAREQAAELLEEVNLTPSAELLDRYPHEISGGQRQRVAIARALAARPQVLIADEPVSMLDVSIRLGVLNLFQRLITERGLAMLYITHDIASARYFAASTLVMYAGELIEGGPSEALTQQPAHPYTQLLVGSAPNPAKLIADEAVGVTAEPGVISMGEPPSLIDPPSGCRFHPRCPHAMERCSVESPVRTELGDDRWVRCWLFPPDEEPTGADRPARRTAAETPGELL
jgi:peptide/nickel transport system ATP-binding protein